MKRIEEQHKDLAKGDCEGDTTSQDGLLTQGVQRRANK
jgi:hypothetical protein